MELDIEDLTLAIQNYNIDPVQHDLPAGENIFCSKNNFHLHFDGYEKTDPDSFFYYFHDGDDNRYVLQATDHISWGMGNREPDNYLLAEYYPGHSRDFRVEKWCTSHEGLIEDPNNADYEGYFFWSISDNICALAKIAGNFSENPMNNLTLDMPNLIASKKEFGERHNENTVINDHRNPNYQKQSDAIKKANKRWNKMHSNYERTAITYDDWLESFQSVIKNCRTPIINLGCGSGNDTLYLIEKGKEVVPCDYSSNAIQNIKKNFPEVKNTECFDMSKGLPFDDNFTDLIICDLSLHYFIEEITFKILEEIKRVLKPNGILLFRVNSTKDINRGAGEGKEIEPHLYETSDGRYKRFFNQKDIEKFFADWENLFIHEEVMKRYEKEKVLWKCAMRVKK